MAEEKRPETRAVTGYDRAGNAKIFDLRPGQKLPEGWVDAPPPGTHPNDPKRGSGQTIGGQVSGTATGDAGSNEGGEKAKK